MYLTTKNASHMNSSRAAERPAELCPAICAYYHIRPVWVIEEPSATERRQGTLEELTRDVYRGQLSNGIRTRVRRDGLFIFDCTNWTEATELLIPAYSLGSDNRVPTIVSQANQEEIKRVLLRTRLMNVHQACISSAHSKFQGATQLGRLCDPSRYLGLARFEDNIFPIPEVAHEPVNRFVYDHLSMRQGDIGPRSGRRVLEREVIEYSFKLLDEILQCEVDDILVLIEMIYRAGIQHSESRHEEALISTWIVCERLLNISWEKFLQNGDGGHVNSKRKRKLLGRDFTASVLAEILEMNGSIPNDLYEEVEVVRKKRNDWMHGLKEIGHGDSGRAVHTAQNLLGRVSGVEVSVSLTQESQWVRILDPPG